MEGKLRFHFPLIDAPLLAIEVHANLIKFAGVGGKRRGIALLGNLSEGGIGTPVVFEFEDIDIILGLGNHVYASVADRMLHLCVEAQELCDEIERILEIELRVTYNLIVGVKAAGTAMRFMNASGLPFSIS